MTTELERKFFETFNIQPTMLTECSYVNLHQHGIEIGSDICLGIDDESITCVNCNKNKPTVELYPTITDKHYFKLMCLFVKHMNCYSIYCVDYESAKEQVLEEFIIEHSCFNAKDIQEIIMN